MKAGSGRAVSKIELSCIEIASWIGLAAYLALVIGFAWEPTPLAQALAGIGIAIAFVHAARVYGLKDAAVLAVICLGVTFTMENIGDATGFPFGRYHFAVGANLPHVGTIPIIVGPLWFGMGYFSWIVAGTLLGGAETRLNRKFEIVARPVVAALVMTQWDVVMDPPLSTISKAWIWHDGGTHFGVPLSNYLGWLLTAWLFYQAFAIYLSRRHVSARTIGRLWACVCDPVGHRPKRRGGRCGRPCLAHPGHPRGNRRDGAVHDVLHLGASDIAACDRRPALITFS
jgi:uncharacterized membrane protein